MSQGCEVGYTKDSVAIKHTVIPEKPYIDIKIIGGFFSSTYSKKGNIEYQHFNSEFEATLNSQTQALCDLRPL